MSLDIEMIVSMALVALPQDRIPTEEEIKDTVGRLAGAFGLDDSGKARVIDSLMARCLVKMDTGFALVEKHTPWVSARKPEIEPFFGDRFKLWLRKERWSNGVITGLDRTTDEILDLLGDPSEPNTWKRRGLVMGDVQSGKTATYSALICKAADAGYRFIILLTGTIENLRRQTQERLDEGFVGFDSSELLKRNRRDLRIGVGQLDGRRQATVFTSSSADFRAATLESLGLSLRALREPALVVIKKNTKILQNLRDWVRSYNAAGTGAIDVPLLMIDDEADNASVNTNDENRDSTRVNAGIRELLSLFRRTSYVGFTATPFANIFVDPDRSEDMLGDDLFPRDFIYTLRAPTNYFGPRRIFLDDQGAEKHLRKIDDGDDFIPPRHFSTHHVTGLPDSLLDALCTFLVSNAIRDLRGEGPTHRSMLVNVSQFTSVQDQVESLLHNELERLQTDIRNFSSLTPATALENASMERLRRAWHEEYLDAGFDWAEVQGALRTAALPVTTIAVNQRTGSKALNYKAHREKGLRVVAVGGNSLSRGLTLEGLTVSYFRRSTKMYDTLLQMGRWFGFRRGYEDLCRVWLPELATDWYGHISEATEELRSELMRMASANCTPGDFGLAVRAHPDSLLVTARNKMRTATEITRIISVSGQGFESVEIDSSGPALNENWDAVCAFVREIEDEPGVERLEPEAPVLLRGVGRQRIAALLRKFRVPPTEFLFQPDAIADMLDEMPEHACKEWDVVIPSGTGYPVQLGSRTYRRLVRQVLCEEAAGVLVVSGNKRRVGSRGGEAAGLTQGQREQARQLAIQAEEETAAKKGRAVREELNVADRFYRKVRTRPLLLLYVLQVTNGKSALGLEEAARLEEEGGAVVAVGLSFPVLDDTVKAHSAKYKINLVKARELFGRPDFDDDVEEQDP